MSVPASRLTLANAAPPRPTGEYLLYWMTAARRSAHSYGLDRAVERARELGRPSRCHPVPCRAALPLCRARC